MTTRVSWRQSTPVGLVLLPALLFGCLAYFAMFAADLSSYEGERGLFRYALNSHDHSVYINSIDRLQSGDDVLFELSNDVGIARIYIFLAYVAPFLASPDFAVLSLVFNCAVLLGCYAAYSGICRELGIGLVGRLSFFANTSLVYFTQLINKDLLTILAFLIAVKCGMNRRLYPLLFLLPVLFLVRQQLAVFVIVFVYLMQGESPWRRICLVYVVTSLTAGALSVLASVIGEESLGGGFSAFLVEFNQKYYVGYLLFNPLRVVQYVIDALASFDFWVASGGVDTAKLLRLPQLVLLLVLIGPISTLFRQFGHWVRTPARPLVFVIVAYLLTWLMNPTVNARYVMLIAPVLTLFALYARKHPQLLQRSRRRAGPRHVAT